MVIYDLYCAKSVFVPGKVHMADQFGLDCPISRDWHG